MKKDLLIAGFLVVLAGLGIGVVVVLPFLQKDDDKPKTIESKPEPIALLPKKDEPRKPAILPKKEEGKLAKNGNKTSPTTTPIGNQGEPETTNNAKETDLPGPKKADSVPDVKTKKEDKKRPIAKIIALGEDLIKLNDPDGEYTVKSMHRGMNLTLIGTIKTLKIAGLSDRSFLDASELVAEDIIFTGNMNSGSKVLLGKAKTLRVRDINQSMLDASAAEAREIHVEGGVNSQSTVKLHALKGTIEFLGEVNDRSQIEIAAPDGKVLFKGRGDSVINGDAKLTVLAREVEFGGAINGVQTQVSVTLTKGGALKFRRLSGGVRLHYRKADAGDPAPRLESGQIDARADFRLMPPGKN